jgi:hypothetical protein
MWGDVAFDAFPASSLKTGLRNRDMDEDDVLYGGVEGDAGTEIGAEAGTVPCPYPDSRCLDADASLKPFHHDLRSRRLGGDDG